MNGERAAEHHARTLAADAQGDEVSGSGNVRDSGRCEGQDLVTAHATIVEHFTLDLN